MRKLRRIDRSKLIGLYAGGGYHPGLKSDAVARYEFIKDGKVLGIFKLYIFNLLREFGYRRGFWWGVAVIGCAEISCMLTGDAGKLAPWLAWSLPYIIIPMITGIKDTASRLEYAYAICTSYCNSRALMQFNRMIDTTKCIKSLKRMTPLPNDLQQFADSEIERQLDVSRADFQTNTPS